MEIVLFIFNSLALGVGLAMDAFSVALAEGVNAKGHLSAKKGFITASTFALFQGIMPLLGWFFLHTAASYFKVITPFIPTISSVLLVAIGSKMIYEGITIRENRSYGEESGGARLLILGLATSLDALSAGFSIADRSASAALTSAFLISSVTFLICFIGINLGEKISEKLPFPAEIFGGGILLILGVRGLVEAFL